MKETETEIEKAEEQAIKQAFADILINHNKVFISIIGGFVLILLSLISYIYLEGENDQKEFNDRQLIIIEKLVVDVNAAKNCLLTIKKYILLKDEIDLDKIEDQHLWDDLIKELKETSNTRGAIIKEFIDTISVGGGPPSDSGIFLFPMCANFNCIIKCNLTPRNYE